MLKHQNLLLLTGSEGCLRVWLLRNRLRSIESWRGTPVRVDNVRLACRADHIRQRNRIDRSVGCGSGAPYDRFASSGEVRVKGARV